MGRLGIATAALLATASSLAMGPGAQAQEARRVVIQAEGVVTEDSNVARSDASTAALRGIDPQDTIFTPGLGVDIYLPRASSALFLKGDAGYDFYRNNHILNSERLDLKGGFKVGAARCRATVTGGYARRQSDLQDLTLLATRNVNDEETIKVEGECDRRIGLAPTASVEEHWSNNSNALLFPDDYRAFTAKGGLAYRRPVFGELFIEGRYDRVDFPNRLLGAPDAGHDGYDAYAAGIRFVRRLGGRIEATARIGYVDLRPDDPAAKPFQGVTYGLEASVRPGGRAVIRLNLARDVAPSGRPDTTYVRTNSYAVDIDYAIGPRINLSAGADQSSNRYVGPALIPGFDLANDRIRSVHAGLKFDLGHKRSLSFDGYREVRRANLAEFSYGDTRGSVTLAFAI